MLSGLKIEAYIIMVVISSLRTYSLCINVVTCQSNNRISPHGVALKMATQTAEPARHAAAMPATLQVPLLITTHRADPYVLCGVLNQSLICITLPYNITMTYITPAASLRSCTQTSYCSTIMRWKKRVPDWPVWPSPSIIWWCRLAS